MKKFRLAILTVIIQLAPAHIFAWQGMPTPQLHVEGRSLKDPHGNIVKLHGFAQTYSPWFNKPGIKWSNYNVAACLTYNKGLY